MVTSQRAFDSCKSLLEADDIVVLTLGAQDRLRFGDGRKDAAVQVFVPQLPVEPLKTPAWAIGPDDRIRFEMSCVGWLRVLFFNDWKRKTASNADISIQDFAQRIIG